MLLLFFVAMRDTSVAIGMFLLFLAPVWVALLAPRVFRARTERIVYPALVLALAGLAAILLPSLLGEGVKLSAGGVAAGLAAGLGYAAFQLIVKDLTRRVAAVTIVVAETWLDAVILLPLALVQTVGAGYQLTTRDLVAGVVLGIVCTALAYMMWTAGMGRIKVQHSSIMGYLEPVSGPIYALLLLGQAISLWTVAGGALIVAAGVLVVLFGEHEEEGAVSLEPGP
jgi:DME family drug/metabolite transporter